MRFDPANYAASAGSAAVTAPLVAIPEAIVAKAASAPGEAEDGAVQVHDGIGVFKWLGTVGEHVDDIPPDQITMGMVLVNDGGFALRTRDSATLLALPVGAVWRLDSHVAHQGVQTDAGASHPQFIGILWDAGIEDEPTPAWFAAEAMSELWAWVRGDNPSRYERKAA